MTFLPSSKASPQLTMPDTRTRKWASSQKIFSDRSEYAHALEIAQMIGNSYQKSQALLYILSKQMNAAPVTEGHAETP
jgi:hypothetical protein